MESFVMETLLCRRFELALASGRPLEEADPQVLAHPKTCSRCRLAVVADDDIAGALRRGTPELSDRAHRRIGALVSAEARADQDAQSRPPIPLAWLTAAVILLVSVAGAWTYASSQRTDVERSPLAQAVPQANGEPMSGLTEMIQLHTGAEGPSESLLPEGALLYRSKVPIALQASLSQHDQSAVNYAPSSAHNEEATLFVLSRTHIALDPVIDEIITADGSINLSWNGHQVTLAPQGDQLFVVISTPETRATQPTPAFL
ncbi:MAG: hypothetical protein ACI9OJ_002528 [Myxococcota bacterium]|jgi:hypothetical protein